MEFAHVSVLLNECIDNLNIKADGIYADFTLGGGGHSYQIASRLTEGGHLYGVDQDADAIAAASKRLEDFKDRVTIIRDNYENAVRRLRELGVTGVDGILIDLGVSSWQLDDAARGFSYNNDAPLDMRMDQRQELTAREIVNEWPLEELYHIIRDYGEDGFARNIAKHICMEREKKPIETTLELDRIVHEAIPAKMRTRGGNPSKRTFQAIRIACNRELDVLSDSLDGMIDFLNPGGRLCIITFHSLEDRIVKSGFKRNENPCTCPPEFPVCVCGKISKGKVLSRKPILPSREELEANSRSASAKLRVFEKTGGSS
ncbi:16S rRNA (cytosine(1402)-N(4))-methyltransferase RsmH [Butyrivibrio sp. MC2013]|uniref:16S rRNA (cytosine(1402)-N(4))-methyltransferase RsmH n=1 Tax=Butyrivibrio sp. MC2013 TaxID=1280686 RepID=UPI00041B3D33|nr:16S rRNA (cytosine(1402)-N(4))-methyltransferase RsmH [Butyrivibrio sp. MC2013]